MTNYNWNDLKKEALTSVLACTVVNECDKVEITREEAYLNFLVMAVRDIRRLEEQLVNLHERGLPSFVVVTSRKEKEQLEKDFHDKS